MRFQLMLMLLCQLTVAYSQGFKVVVASPNKITRSSANEMVKPLDELPVTESISISTGGYLIMVDRSSNIFEFSGPAQLKLDTLKGRRSSSSFSFSQVELLFSSLPIKHYRDDHPYVIFYPFAFSNSFAVKDSVTLKWKDRSITDNVSTTYQVLVSDEFGDVLLNKVVDQGTEFKFSMRQISSKKAILIVKDKKYPKNRKSEYKIVLMNDARWNDSELNSSATNLLNAFFLEMNGFLMDAYEYFQKAEGMSPNQIEVKELTSLFKKRNGIR